MKRGMSLRRGFAWSLPLLFIASAALADVAPDDPCDGASAGDACETSSGAEGTCVDDGGSLVCETEDDGGCSVAAAGTRPDGDAIAWGACVLLGAALHRARRRAQG